MGQALCGHQQLSTATISISWPRSHLCQLWKQRPWRWDRPPCSGTPPGPCRLSIRLSYPSAQLTALPPPLPTRAGPAPPVSTWAPRTGVAVPGACHLDTLGLGPAALSLQVNFKKVDRAAESDLAAPERRRWWLRGWLGEPGATVPADYSSLSLNRILLFRWVLFAACSPVNQAGYCLVGSSQDLECHLPSSPQADITSHLGNELPLVPCTHPGRANLSNPPLSFLTF